MPSNPHFKLVVVTTSDGYIARFPGENVASWSSPEEQAHFRKCFEGMNWSFMGRTTHEQVLNPERWRIVFSGSAPKPEWRDSRHLWLNPHLTSISDILAIAGTRHPVAHNLILGGTAVHDWFLTHNLIDKIELAIEPIAFGKGLPLFTSQEGKPPIEYLITRGYQVTGTKELNAQGSLWHTLARCQDD